MVWKFFGRKKAASLGKTLKALQQTGIGESPYIQDTRAAIEELSQVVKNDPEAVEIYLALGNLYRSQGELERAIQIRNSLIVRPGLEREFKSRAYFELGRDFRRAGFLDRAEKAFHDSRSFGHDPTAIHHELARLAAERGFYDKAADSYGQLGMPLPQAHYLVRLALDFFEEGHDSQANRALRHAIRAYPASIEAWLEQTVHAYRTGNARKAAEVLRDGLGHVKPSLRFVLLEGLLQAIRRVEMERTTPGADYGRACKEEAIVEAVIPVIESQEPDVLLLFYGAAFLQRIGDRERTRSWLEKGLVLQPDFWLARLELFELSRADQTLTPFFRDQLDFFIERAHKVRRFYCSSCGLKRDQLFFNCPRCRSWHSIAFRTDFSQ